jgi:hypothetical protein
MAEAETLRLAQQSWEIANATPWAELSPADREAYTKTVRAVLAAASQPPMLPQPPFSGLPVHNQLASTVSCARTWLVDIKGKGPTTSIPTATLELLLNTLIAAAEPVRQRQMSDGAERTVAGHVAAARSTGSRLGEVA